MQVAEKFHTFTYIWRHPICICLPMTPRLLSLPRLIALCGALLSPWAGAVDTSAGHPPALPALGTLAAGWTASGAGAGGFMAVQFQVAWSDRVRAVGVQGGGAFNCAGGSARSAALTCTCPAGDTSDGAPLGLFTGTDPAHCMVMPPAVMARRSLDSWQALKPHLQTHGSARHVRVWLHAQADDAVFPPAGLDSLVHFYRARGTPGHHIRRVTAPAPAVGSRWQGDMLRWLHPRPARTLSATAQPPAPRPEGLRAFDQRPFHPEAAGHGLAESGLVYVPAACEPGTGSACRVHVHFHGCMLEADDPRGMRTLHAWAEALRIVVLHPRAATDPARNPGGCWDFWGATTTATASGTLNLAPAYARADAPQIGAVQRMLSALARPAAP